jgi:hypothetical protein
MKFSSAVYRKIEYLENSQFSYFEMNYSETPI